MPGKKLRLGSIGVGGIARTQHLPHWKASPEVELVAVADVDLDRAKQVAREFDIPNATASWEELVAREDVDVVDITTPNRWHAPMSIAALEAGKHVLCEKPMATTAKDAERMLQVSQAVGRKLMINHHLRFSESLTALRLMMGEEGLGEVYHGHARWTRRRGVPTAPTFITRELAAGGPVLDLGVHMLDLAWWLMGFPKPLQVSASLNRRLAIREDMGGDWGDWDRKRYDVEDFGVALFRFDGGATLLLEVGWMGFQPTDEIRSLSLLGTKAGLHWPEGLLVAEKAKTPYEIRVRNRDENSPFRQSIQGFIKAIVEDTPVPIDPTQTLGIIQMVDALHESSLLGRTFDFDVIKAETLTPVGKETRIILPSEAT